VQFYQASLTASDIDKLVRFEVLSYGEKGQPVRGGRKKAPAVQSKVNWDLLERRIAASDKAYQRQIIRRKIDELVQYYEQCRQARDLPSIPGAVIISCDEPLRFEPVEPGSSLGLLKVPEREGILRAIDGQHRLLALHADIDRFGDEAFTVPAVIFDRLPEDHVVQMFVTINAKHTRLNASHLVSLSGRQLYRDENLAAAHDIVRALNDREDSPLYGEIKLLGVGSGRVAQAPLAQELKKLFASEAFGAGRKGDEFLEDSKKFFVNYFKQVAQVFNAAWSGRKYSIRSATALRAFIRVAPDVVRRLDQEHADRSDFRAIGRVIAPWGRRIGDLRFETEGAWKRSGTTVDSLAKELRLALQYPEGAAV
jgi:DGQHR domain-containing protein